MPAVPAGMGPTHSNHGQGAGTGCQAMVGDTTPSQDTAPTVTETCSKLNTENF